MRFSVNRESRKRLLDVRAVEALAQPLADHKRLLILLARKLRLAHGRVQLAKDVKRLGLCPRVGDAARRSFI
jgi:hypothetical protein